MKAKKTKKVDLERKKGIFLQIGILVALSMVYMAFEWNTSYNDVNEFAVIQIGEDFDEEILNTYVEPAKKKPIPKVKEIVVVDEKVDEPIIIDDAEADQDQEVEIYEMDDEEPIIEDTPIPDYMCEEVPSFPGGENAYLKFVSSNTEYPEISRENDSFGTVYISFVVTKKGEVTKVKVVKGVDPFIDKEALRVFESMPKWKPGKQNGIPVSVTQMGRVNFTLSN